jgi:hypothetical protein
MLTGNGNKNNLRKYSVLDIRDFLSGEFEPITLAKIMAYFDDQKKLKLIKLIERMEEPMAAPKGHKTKSRKGGAY